jgi:hypothetical protein
VLDEKGENGGCPQRGGALIYYCYLELKKRKKRKT